MLQNAEIDVLKVLSSVDKIFAAQSMSNMLIFKIMTVRLKSNFHCFYVNIKGNLRIGITGLVYVLPYFRGL